VSTLSGRRLLVTGATGDLGSEAVRAAATAGAEVVAVGRSADRLAALTDRFGSSIVGVHTIDLLDATAVSELAVSLGPVDGVWHLVGGWRGGVVLPEQPLEDWQWLHDQLVRTTLHVARSFAEPLKESHRGRFAIISAKEAMAPTSKNAGYASAKAAAEALVLALANDFVGTGATANAIVVPAILTQTMRDKNPDKDWGAFVPAEQIAQTLVHLTSDAGAKMNGQRVRLYSGAPS
jgi:NADP-dependent 3-hydroxy acid dehydrogenase YdfG